MLKRALFVVALLVALPYVRGPVYRFKTTPPFSGQAYLNPYADVGETWQRANLHAHGTAWWGLTSGRQPAEQIVTQYRSLGYNVAGISDYHRIASHHGVATIPLYEHGYNIGKIHQLAIGARQVAWFDFPLWQSLSHKQFVLDRVAETADLVALAHPGSRYSPDDVTRLTGFHLIEIVNGPHPAMEVWDAALSAGRAVWGIGNDDTHDLNEQGRTAVAWTMINAPSPSTSHIVDALRAGRSYTVWRNNLAPGTIETVLGDVTFEDGTLTVSCEGDVSTFEFIGQNGVARKTVKEARSASYTFGHDDTYIRAVIQSPRTAIFLNPVLRYDGVSVKNASATINVFGTWMSRGALALACCVVAALFYRRRGYRRRGVSPVDAALLLPTGRRDEA